MCSGISISRSAMDCRNVDYCRWEMKIKMKMNPPKHRSECPKKA